MERYLIMAPLLPRLCRKCGGFLWFWSRATTTFADEFGGVDWWHADCYLERDK